MRVIAGKFRSRPLRSLPGVDLRPTADRLRETLFNVLAAGNATAFEGKVWLDLCAGTGAVGIEALSRGAAKVYFVESSPPAAGLIELASRRFARPIHDVHNLMTRAIARFLMTGQGAAGARAAGRRGWSCQFRPMSVFAMPPARPSHSAPCNTCYSTMPSSSPARQFWCRQAAPASAPRRSKWPKRSAAL